MAAARAATTTVPGPAPRRAGATAGRAGAGVALSNQCSGVGSRSDQLVLVQSVRGSGAGEYEAGDVGAGEYEAGVDEDGAYADGG
jgi:hypothetical protein